MNAEQKKRRDELADKYSDNGQQHEDYLNGYDAGFKDSEIHKASCCMDMELEIDELKRKLEVAKKALEQAKIEMFSTVWKDEHVFYMITKALKELENE